MLFNIIINFFGVFMKKLKGLLVAVMMLCSTSVFAKDFDWSQCWCNYGAGIKSGTITFDIATGFNETFTRPFENPNSWSIPYFDVTFDIALPIWKLPFSWGAFAGSNFGGASGKDLTYSMWFFNFGGHVKYHVLLPVENLYVYAGFRFGASIGQGITNSNGVEYVDVTGSGFYWSGFLGAHYYLNKNFGFIAEFGYPVWLKAGISLKF